MIVQKLLNAKVPVDAVDSRYGSALVAAASHGHSSTVTVLDTAGANLELVVSMRVKRPAGKPRRYKKECIEADRDNHR
jgi:hypothetical protein